MNRRGFFTGLIFAVGSGAVAFEFVSREWLAPNRAPDFRYLNEQRESLAALAEVVIPRTDTPGANDAGIVDTMIMLVTACTPLPSQRRFIEGLRRIERYCSNKYGKSLQDCNAEQQRRALQASIPTRLERGLEWRLLSNVGKSFFETLKQVVTISYCTSQVGATQALAYDLIPGALVSCRLMKPNERGWATL